MPVFELILSSDTINEGRIKINDAFSATTGLWSGGTGLQSLFHNNGTGNIASGDYAIATGSGTTASGDFSFTKGIGNLSSGVASTAEGGYGEVGLTIFNNPTSATTYSSHAEGLGTLSSGLASHSEGAFTTVIGNASHAEGSFTTAAGNSSHSEGYYTTAISAYSHAEGESTTAFGDASHAEGGQTKAIAERSHAEGNSTTAVGIGSHAEGSQTTAFGNYSHAEGANTTAIGDYSHVGGLNNYSISDNSVIIGGDSNYIDSTATGSMILGANGSNISAGSIGCIVGGGGSITNNSILSHLISTNGNISNSLFSSIESSFGPVGGVCEIIDSSYSKIIGRDIGNQFNRITDSNNSSIINSNNCRIEYGNKTIILASDSVSTLTGVTSGDQNCLIMGTVVGPTSPDPGNKTIRLHAVSGRGHFNGGAVTGGADYAELFEWEDGNINNEKRYGYFVSLNGDKIEIGNHNLIGIVSVKPSVLSDEEPFRWKNAFVLDEWGNMEYITYKKYKIQDNEIKKENSEIKNSLIKDEIHIYIDERNNVYSILPGLGDILGVLYTGDTTNKIYVEDVSYPKISPLYDPIQEYIPREDRPEWSPIGLLGKLRVRTAEQITGSTVSANSDGMAINGSDYHVLETIKEYDGDYGIVKILFK